MVMVVMAVVAMVVVMVPLNTEETRVAGKMKEEINQSKRR
jgi:hypothetical protein